MSDDDALAKALNKAALARALKNADDGPLRDIASRLDMTTADVLRLPAAMIERPFP
jgi:putative heme iron utilization protein